MARLPSRACIMSWSLVLKGPTKGAKEIISTLPKTNIAPENGWLEDYFPFGKTYFRGYVSFREGTQLVELNHE